MYIPGISTRRLDRRSGGGGAKGGSGGGRGRSGSGKGSSSSSKTKSKTSKVNGLPKGHTKATTYGGGGGTPTYVKSGYLGGSYVGGGTRGQVYGTSHHPSVRVSNTISFGFLSVAVYLSGCYSVGSCTDLDYYGLPQNTSRPGGEVVGVTITPNANKSVQFHLISDRHSATEVKNAIQGNCSSVTVGEPTAFNSTNGVRPDTVVQFYRGDSAAILLQGYDNTREMPGRPDLVPNPPFPSSVNMSTWTCLNYTIGESIPLMNSASTLFDSTTFLVFFSILFLRKILDL